MKILVQGKSSKISNSEIVFATTFMVDLLVGLETSKKWNITINFLPLKENYGLARVVNKARTKFEVDIFPGKSKKLILMTLAHELVHVKQYYEGELLSFVSNKADDKFDDYWDSPTEIEAYGRELGLYVRYKKRLKDWNITFSNP